MTYTKIRSLLSTIKILAPLPSLVKSIMEISSDPHSSAQHLADEVKKDQSLTAKILKIVNSAYYGFHREIGNVDHAIVVLGFDEVMNITQAACIIQAYQDGKDNLFDREKFWIHAIGTAYIAVALSRHIPEVISKDAFVVGLLHDFGKVILHQHFRDIFIKAVTEASIQKRPLHEVTFEMADIEHAEIGGLVAESWNFPAALADAIRYHHTPDLAGRHQYEVHIAHLANVFCHRARIGESGNPVPDKPDPGSLKALGFEGKELDKVWESLKIDAPNIRNILR